MKRRAKWHFKLTMAEMRHLAEMNSLTLRGLRANREAQREIEAENRAYVACHICNHIERKLKRAGVLK